MKRVVLYQVDSLSRYLSPIWHTARAERNRTFLPAFDFLLLGLILLIVAFVG